MHSAIGFTARVLALATFFALFAAPARAIIIQDASARFTAVSGIVTRGSDSVTDISAPISTSITASIAGDFGSALHSVGPFGNLGMQGTYFQPGDFSNDVTVQNTAIINNTGRSQFGAANFIIDGGFLRFFAGAGSNMIFTLSLESKVDGVDRSSFSASIELANDSTGRHTVSIFGEDIGATENPLTGDVDIPLFFGALDIGVVEPGGIIDLEYKVEIDGLMVQFVEVAEFAFSDPLNVDGFGEAPTVSFSDVSNAVPEPAAALLLLAGLGLLAGLRRLEASYVRRA